jgi:hypothetical protein
MTFQWPDWQFFVICVFIVWFQSEMAWNLGPVLCSVDTVYL